MTDTVQGATRGVAVYRGMDQAALDTAYNNAAAVSDTPRWLEQWRERSAVTRQRADAKFDIPYGPKERTRFDFFPAGPANAPLFVFIHGGYWQRNAKDLFSFISAGPNAHGINVALAGYTLAPEARLTDIVQEIRQAIAFLHDNAGTFGFDRERIFVGGWSAGAHLTATSSAEPAVKGALAISGIFDLEPIALSYLNAPLQISDAEIATLSPMRTLKAPAAPHSIVVGGDELPELIRQSSDYATRAQQAGVSAHFHTLPGHNHFSILDELADSKGALTHSLLAMIAQTTR